MGSMIHSMSSYFHHNGTYKTASKEVFCLASKVLSKTLNQRPGENISHLITATSCPDQLAPSMGQMLNQQYPSTLSSVHIIDLVQGCAGGASALILGSDLAALHGSNVVVLLVDAARKAVSEKNPMYRQFGNGGFGCIISGHINGKTGLLFSASRSYDDLTNVVQIKLGHDAKYVLQNTENILADPISYLGLSMNNNLAVQLLKKAKSFYRDFVREANQKPEVMIFHQVNRDIIRVLNSIFKDEISEIIDVTEITGNCGAASVGIALESCQGNLNGKKVMICGFGTGGVITAGLWQF